MDSVDFTDAIFQANSTNELGRLVMDFDWKKTLPFIGAIATGNVPALVAAAANAISEVTGTPVDPTPDAVDSAVRNATPEQMAALKKIDADLKVRLRELDIEEQKVDAGKEAAVIEDVKDARKFNAHTDGILYLGYMINAASYACIFAILYGCFQVAINGAKLAIDPGIAAMIGSVVGACVQWLMSQSSQSNGFFFGSSPGSRQAVSDLGKAVSNAANKTK